MFSDRLKAARKAKGLTQEQLAQMLCLERSAVGKYESEKSNTYPSAEILVKLSDILDISIDYLLGTSDKKNRPAFDEENGSIENHVDFKLIETLKKLNPRDRAAIMAQIDALANLPQDLTE